MLSIGKSQFPTGSKEWWEDIAPQIIAEVAHDLMGYRPHTETDIEIRFGNHGSFSVKKDKGIFQDFKAGVGGGLKAMICHLTGIDQKQAIDWLREKGFLDGTFTPAPRTHRPKISRRQATGDMFKVGLNLWQEAKPISFYQQHPVRRWCLHRNLFPGYKELPPTIRWHDEKSLIIVALAPLTDYIKAYPEPPPPRQFQLISIDQDGNKGNAFKGQDKRTWGQPGVNCMALFGDPNHDEINICEGIADGLAILSRCTGAVIMSVGGLYKVKNCPTTIGHLTQPNRTVTIFADNDKPGLEAQEKLAQLLYKQGGDVFFHPNPTAGDPAEAAAKEVKV